MKRAAVLMIAARFLFGDDAVGNPRICQQAQAKSHSPLLSFVWGGAAHCDTSGYAGRAAAHRRPNSSSEEQGRLVRDLKKRRRRIPSNAAARPCPAALACMTGQLS